MITPDGLRANLATALDEWTCEYELDIDIEGCKLRLADDGFDVHVEHISVPEAARRAGLGNAVMTAVADWADRQKLQLRLHASVEYGTPLAVLFAFYAEHGFEPSDRIGGMTRPV